MNTEPPAVEPEAEPPAPDSVWSRMTNVVAAPAEAFDALKGRAPDMGNWLMPALLFMVVGWIGAFLVLNRPEFQGQMMQMATRQFDEQVKAGKMTEAEAETARTATEKWVGISTRIGGVVGPPLYAFAAPFWWGLILWLLGGKLFKGGFPYMKAVEIAGLSLVILILESVLKTLLILATGNLMAGPGPVLLVLSSYDPTNWVHGLLALFQITTLWALAVRGVGISRLGAGGVGRCVAAVFTFWILWNGFWMGVGKLLAALGQRAGA